jgi:hypothetical protein
MLLSENTSLLETNPPSAYQSGDQLKNMDFISVVCPESFIKYSRLTDSFFSDLYGKQSTYYSGCIDFEEQSEDSIYAPSAIRKSLCQIVYDYETYLMIGYYPHDVDQQNIGHTASAGAVLRYFKNSRSLLIESVWMSSKIVKDRLADDVILWMTTYKGALDDNLAVFYKSCGFKINLKRNSGLARLVDKVEKYEKRRRQREWANRNGRANAQTTSENLKIKTIFHEVLNPISIKHIPNERTSDTVNHFANILEAFYNAEGKHLDFEYKHPAPGVYGSRYLLLTFPQIPLRPDVITLEVERIFSFLEEYAQFLSNDNSSPNLSKGADPTTVSDSQESSLILLSPEVNEKLQRVFESLQKSRFCENKNTIYFSNIPRIETPRFNYKRVSVCFEIVVDEDYYDSAGMDPKHLRNAESAQNPVFCPIFHSTETDLFSYKYQISTPYYSSFYGDRLQPVVISFPLASKFISEGRKESNYRLKRSENLLDETLLSDREIDYHQTPYYQIQALASVSYTYFEKSRIRVWRIVLRADYDPSVPQSQFTEMEIIKLMRFFSGLQEFENDEQRLSQMRRIFFDAVPKKRRTEPALDNLIDLLYQMTGVTYQKKKTKKTIDYLPGVSEHLSLKNVTSGIVQIDTGCISEPPLEARSEQASYEQFDSADFLDFYQQHGAMDGLAPETRYEIRKKVKSLYKALYNQKVSIDDLEETDATVSDYANYVFKAYCGIALGIFDYKRMGLQEIDDTLIPLENSKTEESFLVVHRGVLAMFSDEDDVLESFWQTLAMNPYLLVPSAVIANNDKVSRDAEQALNLLYISDHFYENDIDELTSRKDFISELINNNVEANVFQYKTEQEVFEAGMQRRGVYDRIEQCKARLSQTEKKIDDLRKGRTGRFEKVIKGFVTMGGAISLMPNGISLLSIVFCEGKPERLVKEVPIAYYATLTTLSFFIVYGVWQMVSAYPRSYFNYKKRRLFQTLQGGWFKGFTDRKQPPKRNSLAQKKAT